MRSFRFTHTHTVQPKIESVIFAEPRAVNMETAAGEGDHDVVWAGNQEKEHSGNDHQAGETHMKINYFNSSLCLMSPLK